MRVKETQSCTFNSINCQLFKMKEFYLKELNQIGLIIYQNNTSNQSNQNFIIADSNWNFLVMALLSSGCELICLAYDGAW